MKARYTLGISLILVLLLLNPTANAQGDTCTTALLVGTGIHLADGPTTGDGASIAGCGGGQNGDWYVYTASFTGTIKITSCHPLNNMQDDDTYLKVLTGTCDALTCVGVNDDMGAAACPGYGFASALEVNVTAGQNYYIVWTDVFDNDAFYWELSECAGTVVGETFRDLNSNGIRDAGEAHVNTMLQIDPGGHNAYSSMDPYSFCSEIGDFTITLPNPPMYYTAAPASRSYTITNVGDQITGMDFALQPIPGIIDLGVDLWGWNPWIGNNTTLRIQYTNWGTEAVDAAIILTLDPLLSFVEADVAETSVAGQVVTWDLGLLPVATSGMITVTVHTSETAAPNAPVLNTVTITTTAAEINPVNDTDSLAGIATTSFDPNDKQVDFETMTPADIADRKPLEYTVRFQNTGNAPAVNVVIKDSLDSDWDLGTFEMIGASHPYTLMINNEVAIWTFANILLPDSTTDPEGSQGGFHYRMTPKNNLILGDQLTNRADIYFDYNEPVLTNTTVTTVELSTGIPDRDLNSDLRVYPSPSDGTLNLLWSNAPVKHARVLVMDATGRLVHTANLGVLNTTQGRAIDLNMLPNGSYTARLQGDGTDAKARFVIAR